MTEGTMDQWVAALATELELDLGQLDVQALLDVARDAAHSVVRPAAPLTTFLVGYAAGRRAAAGDDIGPECGTAQALAARWAAE
ncbi:DUF6457 domain-containing protein [Demequina sp. SYSU T00192]|uniref:DUF6457 domain-containing protein n=1 Tax=Demequina litoralis TaxID=3051660 RepID=A0ABT8GBL7_9MICO|nr:DUF6457 domain-containing protein [Demequina sp. SYSU T00192]MDN4476534.1 DUF6457 domain-containing protein [Demequina sp. SYSU T00192]